MLERIIQVGDTHPSYSNTIGSILLAAVDESERLGPNGVMRYEAAICLLAKVGDAEVIPEIEEIHGAAAARDPLAKHFLHKIARVEADSFKPSDEMVTMFKLAVHPISSITVAYTPLEEVIDRARACAEYQDLKARVGA